MNYFKSVLVSVTLIMLAVNVQANNNPVYGPNVVFSSASVELTFSSDIAADMFIETHFDENSNKLAVTTAREVSFLQVLDQNGEIEYQLPIGSEVINLNFSDFQNGKYQLNFLIEGSKDFVSLDMNKKQ